VSAVASDGRRAIVGDTLPVDRATVTVTVRRGQGQVLQVSRDGSAVGLLPVPITSDPFTHTFAAARQPSSGPLGTFYRVDTADLLSLTNDRGPVFLAGPEAPPAPATRPGEPVPAATNTPAEVLPRTGDTRDLLLTGLALAAAAAVASAVRRRTAEPAR
jgi:LPXTG-motif cell wall-anchored protein